MHALGKGGGLLTQIFFTVSGLLLCFVCFQLLYPAYLFQVCDCHDARTMPTCLRMVQGRTILPWSCNFSCDQKGPGVMAFEQGHIDLFLFFGQDLVRGYQCFRGLLEPEQIMPWLCFSHLIFYNVFLLLTDCISFLRLL